MQNPEFTISLFELVMYTLMAVAVGGSTMNHLSAIRRRNQKPPVDPFRCTCADHDRNCPRYVADALLDLEPGQGCDLIVDDAFMMPCLRHVYRWSDSTWTVGNIGLGNKDQQLSLEQAVNWILQVHRAPAGTSKK